MSEIFCLISNIINYRYIYILYILLLGCKIYFIHLYIKLFIKQGSKTLSVLISFKSLLISFKRYLTNSPFNVREEWLIYEMLCDIYISLRNQKVFNIIQYLDICSVYKIIVYYFGIEIDEKLIQDVNVPKSPGRRNIQYEVALNIG